MEARPAAQLCVISLAASKLTSFPVNPYERKKEKADRNFSNQRERERERERDPFFSFSLIPPRGNAEKAKPVIFRPKEHA